MVAGCRSESANRLLASDWTNGEQPCSENHLSFRDGKIAYYPKGREALALSEIVWMSPVSKDSELTIVQVRPSLLVLQQWEKRGINLPGDVNPTWVFRVHDGRLALVAQARNEKERVYPPSAEQKNVFDLIACPT